MLEPGQLRIPEALEQPLDATEPRSPRRDLSDHDARDTQPFQRERATGIAWQNLVGAPPHALQQHHVREILRSAGCALVRDQVVDG